MQHEINAFGQPIGFALPDWKPPPLPARTTLEGRFCRVEPLDAARHAEALHAAYALDTEGRMWTYLPYGPFETLASYREWTEKSSASQDPLFYAIVEQSSGQAVGVASYLRIDTRNGGIEVGHLSYSPRLQRTPIATEAMFLMMEYAFSLGYRRYEWKCDSLNAPSRQAAQRLGFSFEGIFRQAVVYRNRNRDTAWYAVTDQDWPEIRRAFARWLAPENFDETGQQRIALSTLTAPLLKNHPS